MDVPTLIAIGFSAIAMVLASLSLYLILKTRQKLLSIASQPTDNKHEHYTQIARVLSEGTMVWQRLMVKCDECSGLISSSRIEGQSRDTVGDWLLQLREFCRKSKNEIDHAYQMFASEAKHISEEDMERQRPDIEKFNKEMRSNVAVISDQLDHTHAVLIGEETISPSRFKITLHKPQAMPHFLRKRQKIAELQRRRSATGPMAVGASA